MINKLINYKKLFPWFKNNKELVYLDNAATTLKPKSMINKIEKFNKKYSYLEDNTNFRISNEIKKTINNTKINLSKFLQSKASEVFFTSGATQSLNVISDLLQDYLTSSDEIIVHYIEHGSNLLPWYRLRDRIGAKIKFVGKNDSNIDSETFTSVITKNTKIVTFTSASNLLANLVDAKKIIYEIKRINPNIICVVDATQQLEHFPAYCHNTNCDFLVGSAHKLIGPTGLGFLYVKQNIINTLKIKSYLKQIENDYLNISAIFGFNESLKLWLKIGYKKINEREKILKSYFLNNINNKKIKLFTPDINSPLITFNIYDKNNNIIDGQDIEFYLGQHGILSRSSLSCAKLAKYPLNTRNVVRISLFFYNDLKDIKKLVDVLNEFKDGDELNGLI